jgi:glycosyltransferase involved in cell wall biosynthesis
MMTALDGTPVTFIGHPFAPIGMGEQLRSHVAAAARVYIDCRVLDIFRYAQRSDAAHFAQIGDREIREPPRGIRIFHINGDEVDNVLDAFAARGGDFAAGYNIIVPAWELPSYPKQWAVKLAKFDEVWALSAYLQESLATAGIASHLIGQSVEPTPGVLLPRRYFGIRESAFVLLHFFDLSSYAARKNPFAVLELFQRIRRASPFLDIQLVLKVKDGEKDAAEWAEQVRRDPQVHVIAAPLDTLGVRSLIAACDCFVSLHRAEGFGRGLGEAMALARLALGTAWSGNLDFMTEANSLLVRQALVPVPPEAYPHGRGQSWAEPDIDHAAALLTPVLQDPARGRARALRGQMEVLRSHGHRAVGLRILDRLEAIAATRGKGTRAASPRRRRRVPAPA